MSDQEPTPGDPGPVPTDPAQPAGPVEPMEPEQGDPTPTAAAWTWPRPEAEHRPDDPQVGAPTWGWPSEPRPDLPATPPEVVQTGHGRRGTRSLLAGILAALVLLSGGIGIGWGLARGQSGSSPIAVAPLAPSSPGGSSVGQSQQDVNAQAVARSVDPAVVDINTTTSADPFAGGGGQPVARGAGTGMIVTSDGEILTNNHVIQGATSIRVTVQGHDGVYSASVLGVDPTADVALLQLHGLSNLPTVTLGDSSDLSVGQDVVAIGNALGRGGTPAATAGQVTALHRDITVADDRGGSEHLSGLIQMDASIQPGDSGGPLVNTSGQVVGMITAAGGRGFEGAGSTEGFAIPSKTAADIANQIRSGHGSTTIIIGQPGYLGIGARDLDEAAAAQLGLGVSKGALVVNVSPSTPAARAGLSAESVITAVDGKTVDSSDALRAILYQHQPGDQVRLTWVNRSGTHTASIRLVTGPAA